MREIKIKGKIQNPLPKIQQIKKATQKPNISNNANDLMDQEIEVYKYGPPVQIQEFNEEDQETKKDAQALIDEINRQIERQTNKFRQVTLTNDPNKIYSYDPIDYVWVKMNDGSEVRGEVQHWDLTLRLETTMKGSELQNFQANFEQNIGKDPKRVFLFDQKDLSLIIHGLRSMVNNKQVERIKRDYKQKSFVLDFIDDQKTKDIIDRFLSSNNNNDFILTIPQIKTQLSKQEYLEQLELGDCVRKIHFSKVRPENSQDDQKGQLIQFQNERGNLLNVHLYFDNVDDFKNVSYEIFQRGFKPVTFPKTELILQNLADIHNKKIIKLPQNLIQKQSNDVQSQECNLELAPVLRKPQFNEEEEIQDEKQLQGQLNSHSKLMKSTLEDDVCAQSSEISNYNNQSCETPIYMEEESQDDNPDNHENPRDAQEVQQQQQSKVTDKPSSKLNEGCTEVLVRLETLKKILCELQDRQIETTIKVSKKQKSTSEAFTLISKLLEELRQNANNENEGINQHQEINMQISKINKVFTPGSINNFYKKIKKSYNIIVK